MSITIFRRKIYDKMLEWKTNRSQKYSLLIKGARRVGKSTIAKEFAKKEFKSYILIDFAHASKAIIELFEDMYDLDMFFLKLQQFSKTRLYENESVIIFDEIQLAPKLRQVPYCPLGGIRKIYLFQVKSIKYQCIRWTMRNSFGR